MIDLEGELKRIESASNLETFDRATDSLEAIRDFLGPLGLQVGLYYYGVVTAIPGANQFTIPTLAGLGAGKFSDAVAPYRAFVFRDAGSAGAAPQGEMQAITAYVTATGVFTTAAFTAAVAVNDEIIILHPRLAEVATILAGLNVPAADAIANALMRDVIGNKTDTAVLAADNVSSAIRYLKGLLGTEVIARGTFTTSSATAPVDNARAEATNWFNDCLLVPVAGACAFQSRPIRQFTAGGTFTLDQAFTAATGLVLYVILSSPYPASRLRQIQGGTESLETLDDELDAILDLARSPMSATTTTTGAVQTLYEQTISTFPWYFAGGSIDLTNLAGGNTLVIKIYEKIKAGGNYRQKSDNTVNTYVGVQTVPIKQIDGFYNQFGVLITMQLTAGANIDIDHQWFDSLRSF